MDHFLLMPFLAGLGFALLAGPLGSFVIWRRLSFFGDTLAHGGLMGIALGIFLQVNPLYGVLIFALFVSFVLTFLGRSKRLPNETVLAIISHGSLALGVIFLSLMETNQVQLTHFLLGDILSVNRQDLTIIFGGGALVCFGVFFLWRALLSLTINEDLAAIEGIPVFHTKLIFMMMLAFTVAIALKIMGVLLITALMILPAATARAFSKTPEQMAISASVLGVIFVFFGLWGSYQFDTPTSPSIVTCGLILFMVSQFYERVKGLKK